MPSPSPRPFPPRTRRGLGGGRGEDIRSPASTAPCCRTRLRCLPRGPCPLRRPRAVGHPSRRYPRPFPRPHHLCPRPRLCRHCPRHRDPTLVDLTIAYSVAIAVAVAVALFFALCMPCDGTGGAPNFRVRQKIDISVCAGVAGRITELLANEEQYRSCCELCAPGVRTVLIEDETTARICRRCRAIVQILYADTWCPVPRCVIVSTVLYKTSLNVIGTEQGYVGSSPEPWISLCA